MAGTAHRVGIDVGGTFTDVVSVRDGNLSVRKVPSTPENPDSGVLAGLEAASDRGELEPDHVDFLCHGTTVATNAVLERDWADTMLVTTDGFRDVLEIGRQARPDLYDLDSEKPPPIVPRERRVTVSERLDDRGDVLTPLSAESVDSIVEAVRASEPDSVAISLLFSFENAKHEKRIARALRDRLPAVSVSTSHAVLPEIREYERTLATALNAALKPVMDRYLGRLEEGIAAANIPAPLRLMQSNGGIMSARRAREQPVTTLLSGPAAGVQGAAHVADLAGESNVITMDMGGTSCDVSLVEGGDPLISTEVDVGEYPVGVPMVEVHTIGAGGGSIAWQDSGGALRVGPKSAGADPGPIAYGLGGTEPTVTDAHVALGRIDPLRFLPDSHSPAPAAARTAIEALGDRIGRDATAAARGILEVANANMERAVRVVSVERGFDPREFALVAFGGAGPLHAPAVARSLDIPRVLVPRTAGVLSAVGLLVTDLLHEFSTSKVRRLAEIDPRDLEGHFQEFEAAGRDRLADEGIDASAISTERALDLRYAGQSFSLRVPAPDRIGEGKLGTIGDRFHERHKTRYGHASPDEPIELVTLRLRARGAVSPPDLELVTDETTDPVRTTRDVSFDGVAMETPIYARKRLGTDATLSGPAIVEGSESTVVLYPGQSATVDPYGTISIETTGANP